MWTMWVCPQTHYEAKVLERSDGKVKVHFIGWNKTFDEWIELGSKRFAPHKAFTAITKVGLPNLS
jgi:uncharacterized Fe-S cluster-containing protein